MLLGTLSVRVDPSAERMAIDSALEAGAKLILANMLTLPPYPLTVMLAREYATLPHEEDLDAVRATARRAAALGIPTELLRVSSPRPVTALIELAHDSRGGHARVRSRPFADLAPALRRRGEDRAAGCAVPRVDRAVRLVAAVLELVHRAEATRVEQQRLVVAMVEVLDLADPQHVIARAVRIDDPANEVRESPSSSGRPFCQVNVGSIGERFCAAKCAAKCCWSWDRTLMP